LPQLLEESLESELSNLMIIEEILIFKLGTSLALGSTYALSMVRTFKVRPV
jgi:hypothetical protein